MEIILSKQCESLTGSLGKGFGYFIQRRRGQDGKYHFFSQRSKHPPIPINGHLRFIFTCAEMAYRSEPLDRSPEPTSPALQCPRHH